MKKKIYISGKMSGVPREQYLAIFHKAEMELAAMGYWTVSPIRFLPCRWPWLYKLMGYTLTLLYDLWHLSKCDYIYKIPGWEKSRGAMVEGAWAFNFNIYQIPKKDREKLDKKMAKFIENVRQVNPS